MSLSFDTLRKANMTRLPQFKNAKGELAHSEPDGSDWSPAEWLQATLGELGELANMLKKVKRGDYDFETGRKEIAKEFADVAIYLDLFAYQFRIDLGEAVREKFNEVSNRVDVPVFITRADVVSSHDPEGEKPDAAQPEEVLNFPSDEEDEYVAVEELVEGFTEAMDAAVGVFSSFLANLGAYREDDK